ADIVKHYGGLQVDRVYSLSDYTVSKRLNCHVFAPLDSGSQRYSSQANDSAQLPMGQSLSLNQFRRPSQVLTTVFANEIPHRENDAALQLFDDTVDQQKLVSSGTQLEDEQAGHIRHSETRHIEEIPR
ncbi:hypothetical protein H0H81_004563, partial [Sphagnurus paluster]